MTLFLEAEERLQNSLKAMHKAMHVQIEQVVGRYEIPIYSQIRDSMPKQFYQPYLPIK